jgi:hypothetical protein
MEKMAGIKDENREETRESFRKLNEMIKTQISSREDIEVLFVNYNEILNDPDTKIRQIHVFLGNPGFNLQQMRGVVDTKLYRQRRSE